MITVTRLSFSVVSRWGSAASRNLIVEYWLWSAMQKSTGSLAFTNGAQNSFITGGCVWFHKKIEPPTSASAAITASAQRVRKLRHVTSRRQEYPNLSVVPGFLVLLLEPLSDFRRRHADDRIR